MGRRKDVLNKINSDLNIIRYNGEDKNQFTSRIIYSALSMWVRFSTLDQDILAPSAEGVSKKHVISRCEPFLDTMLKLFPESYFWFYPQGRDRENPIKVVRDRLYQSGQLVDVGFRTHVGLPEADECMIDSGVAIRKGVHRKSFNHMSGLAQLIVRSEATAEGEKEAIHNFFDLTAQSAQKVLKEYLKHVQWQKIQDFTGELFDKHSEKPFSSCWSKGLTLENNDITLYRRDYNDYGFIKRKGNSMYTNTISQFFIEQFEVRRFMYGLKKEANTKVKVDLKRYPNAQQFELHLHNDLPNKEKSILLLIGWPKNHLNDHLQLLFHESVWKLVKLILDNLHIELEGRANG